MSRYGVKCGAENVLCDLVELAVHVCRYNVTRQSFIGCMRKIEVFSRGTTKINLEDEYSLYVGMYRGCQLQVSLTGC